MAILKKPDNSGPRFVQLPRSWLVGGLAILTLPWLIVGGLYLRSNDAPGEQPRESLTDGPTTPAQPGPWGRLNVTPIVVSPPLEYVAADWRRPDDTYRWYFPGASLEMVRAFLGSTGMSGDQVSGLFATAQQDVSIRGTTIQPDLGILKSLDPQVRPRLYLQLAKASAQPRSGQRLPLFRHARGMARGYADLSADTAARRASALPGRRHSALRGRRDRPRGDPER
jgi:hypothetical protein